jgi:hypothetical protein
MKTDTKRITIPENLYENSELEDNAVYYTLALTIRDKFTRYQEDYLKRHGYRCCEGYIEMEHPLFSDITTIWMDRILIELRRNFPINLNWRFNERIQDGEIVKKLAIFW